MAKYIIGIDEVGRGSLAGPVVVAAAMMPAKSKWRIANSPKGKLRDSKQLTKLQRERWAAYFRSHPKIKYAIARVYPRRIENMNISNAANLAAKRAYTKLMANSKWLRARHKVFLDGGLFLGSSKEQRINNKWNAKTVVRGDEKIKAISAASIIAKVHRDTYMARLAKKYPHYGFEIHKGYGTRHHFNMIRKFGPSSAHRLTFL